MSSEDVAVVKVDVLDVVDQRIEAVEQELEAFVENANREIAAYNGALAELKRLKATLQSKAGEERE